MTKVKVYFSNNKIKRGEKSIFLAGTTEADPDKDWRRKVITLLEKKGYDGVVYNPDYTSLKVKNDYKTQLEWELRGIKDATAILFWVDRDLAKRPGLTTNVEFGYWLHSGRLFYGRPNDSQKCLYLDMLYEMHEVRKPETDLEALVNRVLKYLNE